MTWTTFNDYFTRATSSDIMIEIAKIFQSIPAKFMLTRI